MSDLDDEELEATRRLNGVAKKSDIEKDIKELEECIQEAYRSYDYDLDSGFMEIMFI